MKHYTFTQEKNQASPVKKSRINVRLTRTLPPPIHEFILFETLFMSSSGRMSEGCIISDKHGSPSRETLEK